MILIKSWLHAGSAIVSNVSQVLLQNMARKCYFITLRPNLSIEILPRSSRSLDVVYSNIVRFTHSDYEVILLIWALQPLHKRPCSGSHDMIELITCHVKRTFVVLRWRQLQLHHFSLMPERKRTAHKIQIITSIYSRIIW